MAPEPLVLRGHEGRGHQWGDGAIGQGDELASLGLGRQAQDPAGPVQHQGAGPGFQGLRVEAGGGLKMPGQADQSEQGRSQAPGETAPWQPIQHQRPLTVSSPLGE